jgi:hypothetical protein
MAPQVTDETTVPQAVELVPAPTLSPEVDLRAAAADLAFNKVIHEIAGARNRALRDAAPAAFFPGETVIVTHPLDRRRKIARVTASDPKPVAVISDEDAFRDWMLEHHDDQCEDVEVLLGASGITGGNLRKIITVLRAYAPAEVQDELITTDRRPLEHVVSNMLKRSANLGEPVGPNGELGDDAPPHIEIRTKLPTVTVTLEDTAVDDVVELWRAGRANPLGLPQ